MAAPVSAELANADRVAAALRVAPGRMKKELRVWSTATAKQGERWERAAAMSGTPAQRRAATAIRGRGTTTAALIKLEPRGRSVGAIPIFNGSTARTGWNARNASSRPQFPAPYPQGQEPMTKWIEPHRPDLERSFEQGQLNALARAFPYA